MDPANLDINGFYIFLTIFLVLLNGFFVAAEFAIVRVRGSQIEIQAKAGSQMAKVARGIMHNLDGYLAATQLGITIASLGLGWAGESVVTNIMLNLFKLCGLTITSSFIIRTLITPRRMRLSKILFKPVIGFFNIKFFNYFFRKATLF